MAIDLSINIQKSVIEIKGFGRPFGLSGDEKGNLLITDMDLHTVFRIERSFKSFQSTDSIDGGWSDNVFFSNNASKAASVKSGIFNGPHSIDIGEDGDLYITNYYKPSVIKLDSSGNKTTIISSGLKGPATGFFDAMGQFIIAEYANNSVMAFSADGDLIGVCGQVSDGSVVQFAECNGKCRASDLPGAFDRPHMVGSLPDGRLIVVDTWNHRLQLLSVEGQWLGWLGQSDDGEVCTGWSKNWKKPMAGIVTGALTAPVSVAVEPTKGYLIVTEWGNDRLQVFDLDGHHIKFIDSLGLSKPYDSRFVNNNLVIADTNNARVMCINNESLNIL